MGHCVKEGMAGGCVCVVTVLLDNGVRGDSLATHCERPSPVLSSGRTSSTTWF